LFPPLPQHPRREHSASFIVEVVAIKNRVCWLTGGLIMPQDKNSDKGGQRSASNNESDRRGSTGGKESSGNKSGSSSTKSGSGSSRKGGGGK
jgi:hypothetical protein